MRSSSTSHCSSRGVHRAGGAARLALRRGIGHPQPVGKHHRRRRRRVRGHRGGPVKGPPRRRGDPRAAPPALHAHPDDETLATGVALAHHVARGDARRPRPHVHPRRGGRGHPRTPGPPRGCGGDPAAHHRRGELRQPCVPWASSTTCSAPRPAMPLRPTATPAWQDPLLPSTRAAPGSAPTSRRPPPSGRDRRGTPRRRRDLRRDRWLRSSRPRAHPRRDGARAVAGTAVRPVLYVTLTPQSWVLQDRGGSRSTCRAIADSSCPGRTTPSRRRSSRMPW